MKILIADDEQLVRISLVSMIQELEQTWEIAGEATNGEEMLELLAVHQPDVAIVDIRMPKLDGIEVIRRGQDISPRTGWIILSGFSDFHYARQALQLGVNEYLLKPVVPEELDEAIRTVSAQNREHHELLNYQFENRLFSLCQGLTTLADEPQDSLLCKGNFQALLFYFDSPVEAGELENLKSEFSATMRKAMPDFLVYGAQLALFSLGGTGAVLTGVWDPQSKQATEAVRSFFRHAEQASDRFRNDKFAVTAILTEPCDQLGLYLRQMEQIREWEGFRILFGLNRIWRFEEVRQHAKYEAGLELGQYVLRLAHEYGKRLYLDYQNTIENMNIWFTHHADRFLTGAMQRNISAYIRLVLDVSLRDTDWQDWIKQLKDWGERWLWQNPKPAAAPDLVDQMIRYIEENYMNNTGLSQIADELNVTPSYLSNLFHKKTGTTFTKYLTRLRILKAKQLLSDTDLPIQKVAEQVGYYSTRYFTKLFVESVGTYPSDFRKKQNSIRQEQNV